MEQEQRESNKLLVPAAIIVAGSMIALAIYTGGFNTPSRSLTAGEASQAEISPVDGSDHILGSRSAEVVIIEYSDTECPFCKVFHNTMKQIVAEYDGKVAWVYRHLPIPQLHSRAINEAEATECVAELGGNQAFWNYLDAIFDKTNSNDSLDPAELPRMATAQGIDQSAFESCLSSNKYEEAIKASIQEGYNAGARGTPYSVILTKDGQQAFINGAEPIESVRAKIDLLLK